MDREMRAKVIYWLYLASLLTAFPILIGVAWAYVEKAKNISDLQHSHFDQQFFVGSTSTVVFIIFMMMPIDWLVVIPWGFLAFMSWKGHRALVNGLPAKTIKIGAGSEGVVTASVPVQGTDKLSFTPARTPGKILIKVLSHIPKT